MLIDEQSRPAAPSVDVDICVVGAGPAGIAFAREFIGTPLRVAILESGRFEYDEKAQSLGEGEFSSYHFDANALSHGRRRQFGGTSNLWVYKTDPGDGRRYARCVPAEPIDLAARSGHPDSGWPVSHEDLEPFYQRASVVWNGGPFDYSVRTWSSSEAQPLDTSAGVLETRICQHGPADVFSLRYRDDLIGASNIDVYLGCTAVSLETEGQGPLANQLRAAREDGSTFTVNAQVFVLAAGGVENVQLLLLSDMTKPGAFGNLHDNVGRYVTTHPEFRLGALVPERPQLIDELALYDIRWVGSTMVSGYLTLSEDVKRSEDLLNLSVAMIPRGRGFATAAHRAMAELAAPLRGGDKPAHPFGGIRSIAGSPGDVFARIAGRKAGRQFEEYRGGWSRPDVDRRGFEAVELWAAPEQSADRDNRYLLSGERDWLGRRRIRLDWRWKQDDRDNVERTIDILSSQFSELRLGDFRRWVTFDGPLRPYDNGFHHAMGGTRMHTDPRLGVVDEHCSVHGVDNVYVAGSSVFPSGLGYSNPTLTLLALALRLADRIKAVLNISP